jgi:hypothetical protein
MVTVGFIFLVMPWRFWLTGWLINWPRANCRPNWTLCIVAITRPAAIQIIYGQELLSITSGIVLRKVGSTPG